MFSAPGVWGVDRRTWYVLQRQGKADRHHVRWGGILQAAVGMGTVFSTLPHTPLCPLKPTTGNLRSVASQGGRTFRASRGSARPPESLLPPSRCPGLPRSSGDHPHAWGAPALWAQGLRFRDPPLGSQKWTPLSWQVSSVLKEMGISLRPGFSD